jgi:hypothetical protein
MSGLRRKLGQFGLALPAAAGVVAALGLIRLGRQFPAAASSPTLLVPFLLPVLALALEAGAFVALSVTQLGELSRLPSVSQSLLARVRSSLPLLALLTFVIGIAEMIPRGTEHPGAFANRLVQTARESCGSGSANVAVPLLGLSVRCAEPRRIEGPMPGVRSVDVAMRQLTFADDLRRVDISGLEVTAARALKVHLQAGNARIAGLAPWSRSPRLGPLLRFAILVVLGVALWLSASLVFRPTPPPAEPTPPLPPAGQLGRRLLLRLVFALPGAVLAAAFISLDQDRAAPAAYLGAALLGAVAMAVLGLVARRLPQIFSSFSSF